MPPGAAAGTLSCCSSFRLMVHTTTEKTSKQASQKYFLRKSFKTSELNVFFTYFLEFKSSEPNLCISYFLGFKSNETNLYSFYNYEKASNRANPTYYLGFWLKSTPFDTATGALRCFNGFKGMAHATMKKLQNERAKLIF